MINKTQEWCYNIEHTGYVPNYICLLDDCNKLTRLVCQLCYQDQLHLHKQQTLDHIIQFQDLKFSLYKQQQQLRHSEIQQKYLIQSTIKSLKKISSYCHNQITNINYPYKLINIKKIHFLRTINKLSEVLQKSVKFISQLQQIYQIIKINEYLNNYNKQISESEGYIEQTDLRINALLMMRSNIMKSNLLLKQNLITFYQELQQISSDFNQIFSNEILFIKEYYQERNYKASYQKYFEYDLAFEQFFAQCLIHIVSPNEKYFVFGSLELQLHQSGLVVGNLQNNKELKQLIPPKEVECCKFSHDSKFLYTGDCQGVLCSFYVNQNFKRRTLSIMKYSRINDLALIQNNLIISCNSNRYIKVLSMKSSKQLLIIHEAHLNKILKVEYNGTRQLIISCALDDSIRVHNMSGQLIIDKENAHNDGLVKQIQLINSDNNLLSRSFQSIRLWYVDYDKQKLVLIKQFEFDMLNMSSINNDRNIILLTDKSIKILDYGFKFIQEYKNFDIKQEFTVNKSYNNFSSENFISFLIIKTKEEKITFLVQKLIS